MFRTIEEIKRANRDSGYHFFSADTMRFFGSRIVSGLIGGHYFVTSEESDVWNQPRRYSVRVAHSDGMIDTVGGFHVYQNAREAADVARDCARHEEPIQGIREARAALYLACRHGKDVQWAARLLYCPVRDTLDAEPVPDADRVAEGLAAYGWTNERIDRAVRAIVGG